MQKGNEKDSRRCSENQKMLQEEREKRICKKKTKVMYRKTEESSQVCG
jgi:hypothetical protein